MSKPEVANLFDKSGHTQWIVSNVMYFNLSIISETMLTLVGGTKPSNGRVEIFHNGEWGTLCDSSFNEGDATVLCTMLGYNNTYALT